MVAEAVAVQVRVFGQVAAERHLAWILVATKPGDHSFDSDRAGLGLRVTINPGRDARKRDGPGFLAMSQPERLLVARAEEIGLALRPFL